MNLLIRGQPCQLQIGSTTNRYIIGPEGTLEDKMINYQEKKVKDKEELNISMKEWQILNVPSAQCIGWITLILIDASTRVAKSL